MVQKAKNTAGVSKTLVNYQNNSVIWVPAGRFYLVATVCAVAVFLAAIWLLHDGIDEVPWMIAALTAFSIFLVAFFIREVLMRNARERQRTAARLENSVRQIATHPVERRSAPRKLSIERNDALVAAVRRKSEAAMVLGNLVDAHNEVIELCGDYLGVANEALTLANVGSPRIPAIRKGIKIVKEREKFHLLHRTQLEAGLLTEKANSALSPNDRLNSAQKAYDVVVTTLERYPGEKSLIDSRAALGDFIKSMKFTNALEDAEKFFLSGKLFESEASYKQALEMLGKYETDIEKREAIANKIEFEMRRIRSLIERKSDNV